MSNTKSMTGELESRKRTLYTALGLAALTFLVFVPMTGFDFISFDDPEYVTSNPHVLNGLAWADIVWAFKAFLNHWQPLVWISYMVDFQIYGLSSKGFHFTNLVLHTANATLLFLALKALTGAHWRSAIVAALFAFHPLHVETATWISERKGLLSTTFAMLTLLSYANYIKKPGWGKYLLTLLAFELGLMSKATLVTLPCVLLLLDLWPLGRLSFTLQGGFWKRLPALILEKIPFFVLAGISSFVAVQAQRTTGTFWSLDQMPFMDRVNHALVGYLIYLRKLIWPSDLGIFYPYHGAWAWPYVIGAAVLLLLVSLVALVFLKTRPYLAVGWFWFFGMMVPVIGLVQTGEQSMADRYTYVPLTGLFITLIWAAGDFFAKRPLAQGSGASSSSTPSSSFELGPAVLAVLVIGVCILGTSRQLQHWRNSWTIFEHTERVTGPNYLAEGCLGDLLSQEGRLDEAAKFLQSALQLQPRHPDVLFAYANLCFRQRAYPQAAESYKKVVEINPKLVDAHFNLAVSLQAQGQIEPAIAAYKKTLELQPWLVRAHMYLADLLMAQTNLTEALAHFKEAARLEPGNTTALNGLAWALVNHPDAKMRDGKEALGLAKQTCEKTGSQQVGSLNVLAAAYAETGQFAEAVQTAQKAIDLAKSAGQTALADEISKFQKLYKENKTCRGQ